MPKCLKDNKRCYIHYCPETGVEVECRHYYLANYGGICPEVDKLCDEYHDDAQLVDLVRCDLCGTGVPPLEVVYSHLRRGITLQLCVSCSIKFNKLLEGKVCKDEDISSTEK